MGALGPVWLLTTLFAALSVHTATAATTRKYYVAAQEEAWSYTAGEHRPKNLLHSNDQKTIEKFAYGRDDRIGAMYKKAIYKEYTDDNFTQEIKGSRSRGLVGPVLRAEVGDTLEIVFFNNCTREYSMHPHGVLYKKEHEGAIYVDGTSGRQKMDDIVFPGQKRTLLWNVSESDAPGPNDPNCIPWVYHSHINTERDTSAGLLGIMVTCRQGVLNSKNQRTDVDADYPLLVKIWDENLSWYLEENVGRCGSPQKCEALVDAEDEDFTESNYMAAMNGLMYGWLQDLTACVGKRVAFYLVGMGNEFDIHSLHFHGQDLHYKHTRGDTVSVYSATFVAVEMTPQVPGVWPITDMVGNYERNGMGALLSVSDCTDGRPGLTNAQNATPSTGPVREYFLSADPVLWNYGPTGFDGRTGTNLTISEKAKPFFERSSASIGGTYHKAMFKAYNDSSFTNAVNRGPDEEYLGILGPVLIAEAGDTLKVTLRNNIASPVSLLPHVLQYQPAEEMDTGIVSPGYYHTYVFHVPDDLFQNTTAACMNFIYSSGVDLERDQASGLIGPLLLCRKGHHSNSKPNTGEKFLLLQTFDENKSLLLDKNIKDFLPQANANTGISSLDSNEDFVESNKMMSINGYTFGNLPTVNLCVGDEVAWYVMSLGSVEDVHTATFHGNAFSRMGNHRDTQPLVPGSTAALTMNVDNAGRWIVESHSYLANTKGMYGFYEVQQCSKTIPSYKRTGIIREYFIAAEEIEWDFSQTERSVITGEDLNDPRNPSNIFVADDEDFIGDVYKKAVYRAYTGPDFNTKLATEQHIDLYGPIIKAEVGDVIEVHFKNMASRPYSIHAQGFRYTESDSGTNIHASQGVSPGATKLYTWYVPARSGPGPRDPSCIPFLYNSGIDPARDTNTGLIGMSVICRPGTLGVDGKRKDVDKEQFVLMSVVNENKSWYLKDNIAKHAPNRIGTDYGTDPDFEESNLMHAINGRIHGGHHMVFGFNQTVAWYFASMGVEVDLHSFHLHGHTMIHSSVGHRDDVFNIFPGQAEAVEMIADNPGTWLLHCHTLDHIIAGMETTYTVLNPGHKSTILNPEVTTIVTNNGDTKLRTQSVHVYMIILLIVSSICKVE